MPTSPKEAKLLGEKFYYTGKPCKRGHLTKRDARNAGCCECLAEDNLTWKRNTGNKSPSLRQAYQKYRNTHKEEQADYSRQHYWLNREHRLAIAKMWRQHNPHKVAANTRKRQAMKLNAVPKWLTDWDCFVLEEMYDLAQKRTTMLGEDYVVDHVVPLQGDFVCGLHTPNNLRVITAKENGSKHNKWELV